MEEFRICPQCGYGRGFHVYFKPQGARHGIGLICPSCGRAYDIGWLVQRLEGEPETGPCFNSGDDNNS